MHQRFQDLAREREFLAHKAETLQMEKEEMVRAHTLETGELRKRNTYLQDQLHKLSDTLDRTPMAHQQSSSGFSDAFDFDTEFDLEDCWTDPMPMQEPTVKAEKVSCESDKPAAPGLLLILLLCGALVASSKTATAALPPLPKQLQTASASVLQNIFQDAGVAETGRVEPIEANMGDWAIAKSEEPQLVGLGSTTMNVLNSFSKATAAQQHEFMQLTPAEYNDVTSNNFLREPEHVNSRNRRRIHENLANMRNSKPTAAEVYTRSLLWDRVDAEVVRRFAAFARQAQTGQASAAASNDGEAAVPHS
jgi:hypothetical protein